MRKYSDLTHCLDDGGKVKKNSEIEPSYKVSKLLSFCKDVNVDYAESEDRINICN